MIGDFSSATLPQAADGPPRPSLGGRTTLATRPDIELGDGGMSIRAAGSVGQRASASILLNKRYAWRGYQTSGLPDPATSDSMTLVASDFDAVVGTISVGLDGPLGLLCDHLFLDKVDRIRSEGHEVCEFTKLAMDSGQNSKQTLASLFSAAHIVARRIRGADFLLVEVNPRHVRYYQKMLGFEIISEERINQRVKAPAVLLSLNLAWSQGKIVEFDGNPRFASAERSLYPYFHSQSEESRIIQVLRNNGH